MFTGIITDIGTIIKAEAKAGLTLEIGCRYDPETLIIGESIACGGVCLTVVAVGHSPASLTVQLSPETLSRTAPARWREGTQLNLERALRVGDRLGGHFVTGHVDGLALVESVTPDQNAHILRLRAPAALLPFIAEKGAVTLEGISLTVNKVEDFHFEIAIIPHTWHETTLKHCAPGDTLHLEIDMLARYLARLLETRS